MGLIDRLDPENAAALRAMPPRDLRDIPALRRDYDAAVAAAPPLAPDDVEQADHEVPRLDESGTFLVRVYRPASADAPLPCLLWMHGGGYVYGSLDAEDGWLHALVADVGCAVASVDYRLAPEHPYPAALDDCLAALRWARTGAAALSLDEARLAIGGASSGGGLAAALALRCRDEGGFDDLRLQLLVYPMLDDRHITHSSRAIADPLLWSLDTNLIAWRSYLGCEPGLERVPATAAPSRAVDLSGLPPAFVAVADVDMFADEDVEYAQRLMQAGVRTELIVYPGSHHGVLRVPPDSRAGRRMNADLRRALRDSFEV
jgi:acetyl esterase/lipase